jgi:hypothetical protein
VAMTMLEVFHDFILWCQKPPPAGAPGETHAVGFALGPPEPAAPDPCPYNGTLFVKSTSSQFLLHGFGYALPVPGVTDPVAPLVQIAFPIGHPVFVTTHLTFSGIDDATLGPSGGREEECNVSARRGGSNIFLTFNAATHQRTARLIRSDVSHNFLGLPS